MKRLVTARQDAEISTAGLGHVSQVVSNFELQQGNRPPHPAVPVIVTIYVPAQTHASRFGAILNDCVGGMVMRTFVEQSRDIEHNRRPIEQLQEHRVVVQDIEDARVIILDTDHTGVGDAALLKRSPSRNNPIERLQQSRSVIVRQQPFQDQIAVVVEEKAFCLRGFGFVLHFRGFSVQE